MWHKASASSCNGNCVEVAFKPDGCTQCHGAPPGAQVVVRDSKDPGGAHLHFTTAEWAAFLDGAVKGEFALEVLSA